MARSPLISRRAFVAGGTALAAGALAGGALAGCSSSTPDGETVPAASEVTAEDANSIEVLSVDESQVTSLADLENIDDPSALYTEVASYQLPLGSMLWQAAEGLAVVLGTGSTSSPLSQVKMLDTTTGVLTTIIDRAVGSADGFEIYDVRASSSTVAWSEYDYMTSDWKLYAASLSADATSIGEVYQLDDGDVNWDPPLICVADDEVFWTRLPYEKGLYTTGDSYLRKAHATGTDVWDVYTSHGRMITTPECSDGILTFVPRLDAQNVYYQMTALDIASEKIVSQVTLPASVRVMNALYLQDSFAFSVEASYSSNSAIATMGTYRSLGSGNYLRVARTPSCTPALCRGHLIVKFGKSTAVIDTAARTWFTVPAPNYSWSYGDYLATSGSCDSFIIYSTVDTASNVDSAYVLVRVISLS